MSGSTLVISRVKGGSQVRNRVESEAVMLSKPTAERRPIHEEVIHNKNTINWEFMVQVSSLPHVLTKITKLGIFIT